MLVQFYFFFLIFFYFILETLNKCLQLVENGIGETQSQRWYYDLNLNRCRMFTYAGMKGNQNNFITQNECEEDCLLNPCPTGLILNINIYI